MTTYTEQQIISAATTAHEVNRSYCAGLGDTSQPPWCEAPDWQRESAIAGVIGVINGNTPEQSHQSWLKQKSCDGWKFGPVKDPERKEHPCFVPYDELSYEQRVKDTLFVNTVRGALGIRITGPKQPYAEDVMQFFEFGHLSPERAEMSRRFCEVAQLIVDTVPRCPERSVALRKLLEGKDAAVRAKMWKDTREPKP